MGFFATETLSIDIFCYRSFYVTFNGIYIIFWGEIERLGGIDSWNVVLKD
jgi:hypothetical protein